MKKLLLIFLASTLLFCKSSLAQTDFPIGTGTTGNTNTTYPAPLQDYYEGSRMQFLYRASELTAAGMVAGPITAVKFNVATLNAAGIIEQMAISIGGTTDTTLGSATWVAGTTSVWGPFDYQAFTGTNLFPFSTPYIWNGTDNIVIEVCNGDPNNPTTTTYTNNPTVNFTTGLTFNGSHSYRADGLGNLCGTATTANTGTQTTRPNIIFDTSSCMPPTGIVFSNIATDSVSVTWTPPSSTPSQYYWEIRTSGTPGSSGSGFVDSGYVSSVDLNINGLLPATTYYFYIRSVCGTTSSSWIGAPSFATACVAVTSITENFDATTVPSLPTCWSKILRGSTISATASLITINATANVYSAPNAVSMYNSGSTATDDIMLVSPALSNVGAGTYRLTFYAKNSNAAQDLEIGTLDDNTATANFSVLQTVDIGTTYQKYTVDFSSYTGTDQYIAFRRLNTSTFTYVYLDNIVWELIPSCVNPTGGIVSNITSSSVQLDWTAPSTGTPTGYDVYYNISNVPPTGTTTPTVTGITGTTTTLNGLTPSTKYYFYIRTVCGISGTSAWTDKDSFTTACVPVTALNENFDGVTIPALPVCWSKILRGGTLSTSATVLTTAANANSVPNAVSLYNSGSTATDDIMLVSPALSNVGAGTYRLTFFAKTSSALNDIEVGTLDDNTSTAVFSPLETVDVTTTYQKFTVSFSTYTGTDQYIAIRRLNASTFSYVYVDNVVWELIPTCVEPTGVIASNITTSGAQIDWTAPTTGTPISYDIFYSTVNTAPTGTTTPTVSAITGTSYTVNGLNASSDYYVWVRTNCGTSGFSAWTSSYLFTTACGIITAPTPAAQTFSGTIPPLCWSLAKGLLASPTTITPVTTGNWLSDDFGNVTTPVNKSAKINIYTTNRQDWLMTPSYDLGTSGNFQLEFDLALTAYAATTSATLGVDDKFYVVISTDNGVTWDSVNTLRRWDATTPISNVGEHITIPLATYTGTVMFGFYGESTVSNTDNDLFVDDVELKPMIIFPVEFVSFKGARKEGINQLSWTTATELNNKGFEVQRSLDGEHFSTLRFVGTLAPNGTSSTLLNYQFADDRSPNVSAYYRLKQVNTDGRSKYSNVVLIKGNVSNITLSGVYPNPVKRDVNITIQSPSNDNLTLIITDLAGKVVNKRIVNVLAGDNKFNFNVETLSAGTYIMKAICANGCEAAVQKFVKQ